MCSSILLFNFFYLLFVFTHKKDKEGSLHITQVDSVVVDLLHHRRCLPATVFFRQVGIKPPSYKACFVHAFESVKLQNNTPEILHHLRTLADSGTIQLRVVLFLLSLAKTVTKFGKEAASHTASSGISLQSLLLYFGMKIKDSTFFSLSLETSHYCYRLWHLTDLQEERPQQTVEVYPRDRSNLASPNIAAFLSFW